VRFDEKSGNGGTVYPSLHWSDSQAAEGRREGGPAGAKDRIEAALARDTERKR
jgi:hypothetical protein